MGEIKQDRIEEIFKVLSLCSLSYKQEELVLSFEDQYKKHKKLSEKQLSILIDIYERAGS